MTQSIRGAFTAAMYEFATHVVTDNVGDVGRHRLLLGREGSSHPFYTRLNQLLCEHGFDDFAEAQCATFYAETMGRPSLPPGIYFRLLLIGYFEGIDSERGIAWRAADSLMSCFDNLIPATSGGERSQLHPWLHALSHPR